MKYQIGDRFIGVQKSESLEIQSLDIINNLYLCRYINGGTLKIFDIEYSDITLDSLCLNGWSFEPMFFIPKRHTSLDRFNDAFSNIDLTEKVLESMNSECSHFNYEEKILFSSTYKICLNCKKEF